MEFALKQVHIPHFFFSVGSYFALLFSVFPPNPLLILSVVVVEVYQSSYQGVQLIHKNQNTSINFIQTSQKLLASHWSFQGYHNQIHMEHAVSISNMPRLSLTDTHFWLKVGIKPGINTVFSSFSVGLQSIIETSKPHMVHDLDQPTYMRLSTCTVAMHFITSSPFHIRLRSMCK